MSVGQVATLVLVTKWSLLCLSLSLSLSSSSSSLSTCVFRNHPPTGVWVYDPECRKKHPTDFVKLRWLRVPNSSAVVGHLIRAKPKFTVTCHHYHPTMPSRIPSKSKMWKAPLRVSQVWRSGRWAPGINLFVRLLKLFLQPAIKGGWQDSACNHFENIKKTSGNICQCESASLPAPSSPSSRLDSCTCRSSKRRLSAVMAFPVHSAYLDWDPWLS